MAFHTFYPFKRLPAELRHIIWDLAVVSTLDRPPGAQFFTLVNMQTDLASLSSNDIINGNRNKHYSLAAPQCSGPRKLSWAKSNQSAYMCEFGLLGACSESRWRFRRCRSSLDWDTWVSKIKESGAWIDADRVMSHELDRLPLEASFCYDGQTQEFTIFPWSDLLCIQPYNFDTIRWEDVKSGNPPIIGMGVRNLALEFDPAWCDYNIIYQQPCYDKTGPLRCIATAASFDMRWVEHLWFIDYQIRRRPGTRAPEASRQTFAGNSCRFVEVEHGDINWELTTGMNIFDFIQLLDESLDDYFAAEMTGGCSPPSYPRYFCGQPSIGVLACEKFDVV